MLNQIMSHQESRAPCQPGCPPRPGWLLGPCLSPPSLLPISAPQSHRGSLSPAAGGCPRYKHLPWGPAGLKRGQPSASHFKRVKQIRAKGQGKVKLGITCLTGLQSACTPFTHVQCVDGPAQGVFLGEQRALQPGRRKQTSRTGCRLFKIHAGK